MEPNNLVLGKYYIISGPRQECIGIQEMMVQFLGIEKIETKGDRYWFKMLVLLTECDEGHPDVGDEEHCSLENLLAMEREGFKFRDATATEIVLYGR